MQTLSPQEPRKVISLRLGAAYVFAIRLIVIAWFCKMVLPAKRDMDGNVPKKSKMTTPDCVHVGVQDHPGIYSRKAELIFGVEDFGRFFMNKRTHAE